MKTMYAYNKWLCLSVANSQPKEKNEALMIGIAIVLILVCVGLNFLFVGIEKNIFGGIFNTITGGIWVLAIIVLAGLFIPEVNDLVAEMIDGITNIENVNLPAAGTVGFWIILIICLIVIFTIWILNIIDSECNWFATTLLMLLFGTVHAIIVYFVVGLVVQLLLVAIGLFVAVCIFSGSGETQNSTSHNHSSSTSDKEEAERLAMQERKDAIKQEAMKKYGADASEVTVNRSGDWVKVGEDWIKVVDK